ncbi:MAG: hypothetical protein Q9175_000544 [Cornicularia normoerica]
MGPAAKYPLPVPQSPAIDTNAVPNETWIRKKTIVITGGASGFGEGFFRRWASDGATVVIGDINIQRGDQLVREVRNETGNPNLHFFHCDVTDWQSQVQFFKDAIYVSSHGGIDTVVANAGILDPAPTMETPRGLDAPNPPPPNLAVLDVNLKGRALLAGGSLGNAEDVVEAATRFVADPRVVGRAVAVGPKMEVEQDPDGQWSLVEGKGKDKAIWEVYAHDFEDTELFTRRAVGILNRAVELKGWSGWLKDMFAALKYGMGW